MAVDCTSKLGQNCDGHRESQSSMTYFRISPHCCRWELFSVSEGHLLISRLPAFRAQNAANLLWLPAPSMLFALELFFRILSHPANKTSWSSIFSSLCDLGSFDCQISSTIFIDGLQGARPCSRHWGYIHEQNRQEYKSGRAYVLEDCNRSRTQITRDVGYRNQQVSSAF